MSIYSFQAKNIRGQEVSLDAYKGQVVLIVNTASKCGFTPQYTSLQALYERFKDQGLVVLGFPCNQFGAQEPDSNEGIDSFCTLNYGVTFPMFEKIDVKGANKLPLFAYLVSEKPFEGFDEADPRGKSMHDMFMKHSPEVLQDDEIKWNFTKFLIDRNGQVVARYESNVDPQDLDDAVQKLL